MIIVNNKQKTFGFTMLEAIIVISIIAALANIAVPRIFITRAQSKEAVIKKIIQDTRKAIEQYKFENGIYPPSANLIGNVLFLGAFSFNPFVDSNSICTWINPPTGPTCNFDNGVTCDGSAGECTGEYGNAPFGWVYEPGTSPYFWATDGAHKHL